MLQDIPFAQALDLTLYQGRPLAPEVISVGEAVGRVLAEDIHAVDAIPPFDNSAMDGYGVCGDTLDEGATFTVVGESGAGSPLHQALSSGEAIRIFTGAVVPESVTAVVPLEQIAADGTTSIRLLKGFRRGEHIRKAGTEMTAGERVLSRGELLTAAQVGLLVTAGRSQVRVSRRPRVAILPTGNELLEPGPPLSPASIRNSNAYAIQASLRAFGAETLYLGICEDTLDGTARAIEAGCAADVVVTSGGVSMGEHDYVLRAIEQLGGEIIFWRVRQKPGKPLAVARIGDTVVVALPGNPASTMFGLEMYVKPLLLAMQQAHDTSRPRVPAILTADLENRGPRLNFIHGRVYPGGDGLYVGPLPYQVSGMIRGMATGNAFIVVPPETALAQGATVETVLLNWNEWGHTAVT